MIIIKLDVVYPYKIKFKCVATYLNIVNIS